MKEGWEYKTLGEVANVIHGKNQKEVLSEKGKYPIYGSGGTIMGYATEFLCPAGTTILGRKGTINNPLYIEEDFWNVDTAFGISPKENVSSKFVYYYCRKKDWGKLNTGTTLPSLTQSIVKSQIIPIPSFTKQEEIVSYLDTTFANIEKLKSNASKALSEAKALFQAALAEAMMPKEGWEENQLKKICRVINGRAYLKPEMLDSGKYRLLRVGNFFTNSKWYYTNLELEEDKYCEKGDLLYAWSASFGPKIWDGEKVVYHYHIWKLLCDMNINKKFMYYWLDSSQLKAQVMSNLHGSTMSHITKKIIEDCKVYYPSISQQHQIVRHLDTLSSKVRQMEENYRKTLAECDALKQAILRDVFE